MSQTFTFQTEAKELLELMIHSVYSHRDIFLRELISNASDALDKLRDAFADPHIRLVVDAEKRILSVTDNGIGMNHDDLVNFLGTIAKSGTKEFAKMLRESRENPVNAEMIGQFGVGFYSSFMVADRVEVRTRRAGEEQAWLWKSAGDGAYTVEEALRDEHGTTVTLFLKDADEEEGMGDYASPWTLREIVRRFSDFVSYPIRLKDGDKDDVLNSMKAIWMRPEKDVAEEEYNEFYRHVSHDWGKPLERIVLSVEGTISFRALLFIPEKAPLDLFMPEKERGVSLYVRRVFIMHDCKELIPEYLRFVRGVVDSEDLSLNVSREILQQDRHVVGIRRAVTRKILDILRQMLAKDRAKYGVFWKAFGSVLKEGILRDEKNRDTLLALALFESTAESTTTLPEYVARMKAEQQEILFLTGPSLDAVRHSPQLEAYRAKGYEVLLLADPVDDFWTRQVPEFEGKAFRNVASGEAELGGAAEREAEKKELEAAGKDFEALLAFLRKTLGDQVKDVRLSGRLVESPACFVGEEHDVAPHMERFLRAMGQEPPASKRILEVNPRHEVLQGMRHWLARGEDEDALREAAEVLFGQAILAEGGQLANPAEFSQRIVRMMKKLLS